MKQHLESPPEILPPSDENLVSYGLAAWELELLNDHNPNIEAQEQARNLDKISKFIGEQALNNSATQEPEKAENLDPSEVWKTYEGSVAINPDLYEANVDTEYIVTRLEIEHVVKRAPKLAEQMQQADRDNLLTYLAGEDASFGTAASLDQYQFRRQEITEAKALQDLHSFLSNVSQDESLTQRKRDTADSMIENLTFIGKKEYLEATRGIATYWKELLDDNPELQIYAVAGEIAKSYSLDATKNSKEDYVTKSDEYILDNILAQFSDVELQKYAGRLVLRDQDVKAEKPEDLRVVLLDDWTISGEQLSEARMRFLKNNPDFEESIEIQLIAANEQRVKNGLKVSRMDKTGKISVPLKAYFLAHPDGDSEKGARITGFHSAVDFDFEDTLEFMVEAKAANGDKVSMPAPANLVRPYRMDNQLPNIDRFYNLTETKVA